MRSTIHVLSATIAAWLFVTGVAPLGAPWGLPGMRAPWGLPIVQAQSLADVAREEEARRKEITRPSKVYTNKDLGNVPPAPAQAAPPPAVLADTNAGSGKTAAKDGADAAKDKPKDQKYWSARMQNLRTQLDRDQTFAEALQSRINALTADFSARDDPAQRTVIERDRQKALDELDRLQKGIVAARKAIADLEEEARRASVPPGWLR